MRIRPHAAFRRRAVLLAHPDEAAELLAWAAAAGPDVAAKAVVETTGFFDERIVLSASGSTTTLAIPLASGWPFAGPRASVAGPLAAEDAAAALAAAVELVASHGPLPGSKEALLLAVSSEDASAAASVAALMDADAPEAEGPSRRDDAWWMTLGPDPTTGLPWARLLADGGDDPIDPAEELDASDLLAVAERHLLVLVLTTQREDDATRFGIDRPVPKGATTTHRCVTDAMSTLRILRDLRRERPDDDART